MHEPELASHHQNNYNKTNDCDTNTTTSSSVDTKPISPTADDDDNDNEMDRNNTDNTDNTDKEKESNYKQILKYTYVISALLFGFGIVFLKEVSESIDDWIDHIQHDITEFLLEDHWIYILLVILALTIMKSVGIKDVFGLRTIAVVIFSYKITKDELGVLFLSMFIMGLLSSVSKLVEYKVIGRELQYVIGKPVEYIFKYLRLFLTKICRINEDKLIWFDSWYTLEISYKSRDDKNMDIVNNFQLRYGIGDDIRTYKWYFTQTMYYILSILWTSCIEWVPPITELFLFAHNWTLTVSNVLIIMFAEFVDFDKMVETWYMIQGIKNGDLLDQKISSLVAKVYFWLAGYTIILFPTLYWSHKYYIKFIQQQDNHDNDENLQSHSNSRNIEMEKNNVNEKSDNDDK